MYYGLILFRNETVKSDSKKTGGDYVEIVQMQCPHGWKLFGASCYKFDERSTTWAEADKLCAQEGGRLASIHSKAEDDFIKSKVIPRGTGSAWIGANDIQRERVWKWSDRTPFIYSNWKPRGEPNNLHGNQDCATLTWYYRFKIHWYWEDIHCSFRNQFVCKKQGKFIINNNRKG